MEVYLWSLTDLLGLVGQPHSISYPKSVSPVKIPHSITNHTGAKLGWGTFLLPICLSTANP